MTLRQTRLVSISIPLSPIAPISRRTHSGLDFAPGVESVLYHQPRVSSETPSRTSCRDHAMRIDADSGIPTRPRSHSGHLLHPRLAWVPCNPCQAHAATLQVNEEQDV